MRFDLTFLGTGTSVGVPMINCHCAVCRSEDGRDQRLRASVYVQTEEMAWVVDTGPDFRQQCLREGICHLDAVLFTHAHTDHIMGLDDLRRFTLGEEEEIVLRGAAAVLGAIQRVFPYAFDGTSRQRGYMKPRAEVVTEPFFLGSCGVEMLPVEHGNVETYGYLFSRDACKLVAYFPDCKRMPESTRLRVTGVDTLILGALRMTSHPTHQSLDEAVALAQVIGAKQTWLTHFMCGTSHADMEKYLPSGISPAYDGFKFSVL